MNIAAAERRERKDGLEPKPKWDDWQGNVWQGNRDRAVDLIPLPNIPLPVAHSFFVFFRG